MFFIHNVEPPDSILKNKKARPLNKKGRAYTRVTTRIPPAKEASDT